MNKIERSLGTASSLMAYGPGLLDVDLDEMKSLKPVLTIFLIITTR